MHSNGGNGAAQRLITATNITPDCVLFLPTDQTPLHGHELPAAFAEVLQKWLIANPDFVVRDTLPITKGGNTVGLFLWHEID